MAVNSAQKIPSNTPKSSHLGAKKHKQPDARSLTRLVVRKYRARLGTHKRPLSYARFADELNQAIQHLELQVSYQTIKNWEDGLHRPNYFFIMQLANHASQQSWQRGFAMDILSVQWPDLYPASSEIARHILQKASKIPKQLHPGV